MKDVTTLEGRWLVRMWDSNQTRRIGPGEQVIETTRVSGAIHESVTGYRTTGWRWATPEEESRLEAATVQTPATKHTPGPETIKCIEDSVFGQHQYIAQFPGGEAFYSCSKDRRDLIAAAPDLLAALEAVLPRVRPCDPLNIEHDPEIIAARAAIAKAKGE